MHVCRAACLALLPAWLGLGQGVTAMAAENPSTNRTLTYDSFRIVAERNIFYPGRARRSSAPREDRRPSAEVFGLSGTMCYPKGRFAFFDGNRPEFRKALERGGTIAGHKIAEITYSSVKLERNGKTVELKVNSQLRREEGGNWQSSSGNDYSTSASGGSSSAASSSESSSSAASGTASDALKRLMEQREKELK
jgi:hypothetical protein